MTRHDVWANKFSHDTFLHKYSMNQKETWADTCRRVVDAVTTQMTSEDREDLYSRMVARKFIPAGRYLYAAGREFHQVNNCFLFRADDSREGWSDALHKATMSLMTGGGIGFDYSAVREEGALIKKTGGTATGPISLMQMVNEAGRHIMQGGQRRSAIWAGLDWKHKDVFKFMESKNHSEELKALKAKDLTFPLPLELTNISVIYGTEFWDAMGDQLHPLHKHANDVWHQNCIQAFSTAEPGMSFNYLKDRESLRNACTEVTSEDDSDKCNLGTVWMQAHNSLKDFQRTTELAIQFQICGGLYSHLPTDKIREVGSKNNRIGLGLGGMHEWLMQRGMEYEVTEDMRDWLTIFRHVSDTMATNFSDRLGVARPKGVRAIAPTGTIGIIAETTTGIEPLFCKAYKRRYFKDGVWKYQYVVDGAVKRLQSQGVSLDAIQDSFDLSFEQRVKFQADVQDYIDMAISSTCNLPEWGSENNNEETLENYKSILFRYSHRLRGFTCYPDRCRGGQPLERVDLEQALHVEGHVFEEREGECVNGVCGV